MYGSNTGSSSIFSKIGSLGNTELNITKNAARSCVCSFAYSWRAAILAGYASCVLLYNLLLRIRLFVLSTIVHSRFLPLAKAFFMGALT